MANLCAAVEKISLEVGVKESAAAQKERDGQLPFYQNLCI
jgi:hypothetical protein